MEALSTDYFKSVEREEEGRWSIRYRETLLPLKIQTNKKWYVVKKGTKKAKYLFLRNRTPCIRIF